MFYTGEQCAFRVCCVQCSTYVWWVKLASVPSLPVIHSIRLWDCDSLPIFPHEPISPLPFFAKTNNSFKGQDVLLLWNSLLSLDISSGRELICIVRFSLLRNGSQYWISAQCRETGSLIWAEPIEICAWGATLTRSKDVFVFELYSKSLQMTGIWL